MCPGGATKSKQLQQLCPIGGCRVNPKTLKPLNPSRPAHSLVTCAVEADKVHQPVVYARWQAECGRQVVPPPQLLPRVAAVERSAVEGAVAAQGEDLADAAGEAAAHEEVKKAQRLDVGAVAVVAHLGKECSGKGEG